MIYARQDLVTESATGPLVFSKSAGLVAIAAVKEDAMSLCLAPSP